MADALVAQTTPAAATRDSAYSYFPSMKLTPAPVSLSVILFAATTISAAAATDSKSTTKPDQQWEALQSTSRA
jgi:hypothetical protein